MYVCVCSICVCKCVCVYVFYIPFHVLNFCVIFFRDMFCFCFFVKYFFVFWKIFHIHMQLLQQQQIIVKRIKICIVVVVVVGAVAVCCKIFNNNFQLLLTKLSLFAFPNCFSLKFFRVLFSVFFCRLSVCPSLYPCFTIIFVNSIIPFQFLLFQIVLGFNTNATFLFKRFFHCSCCYCFYSVKILHSVTNCNTKTE